MRLKLLYAIIIVLGLIGGVIYYQKTYADPGGRTWGCGYFTNNCGNTGGFNRVWANGIDIAADKGTFISTVESKLNSGDTREKTGAAFIIQTMRGNVSYNRPPTGAEVQDWKDRINSGDVTISRENYSYNWNSGYKDTINDDVFWPESDTRLSLVFRNNGTIVYALKIDCANSVGDLPGLPPPPAPPPPALAKVRGRVFNHKTQIASGGYSGVTIDTCIPLVRPTTNSAGYFEFTVPVGTGFCLRVAGGSPANSVGPFVRPWSEGYGAQSPGCPGFGPSNTSPLVNHGSSVGSRNFCAQGSYECQAAGVVVAGCGISGIDRNWDEGYDIVFVPDSPPSLNLTPNCTARTVRIEVSDPDGSPSNVSYRIDGGVWSAVSVSGSVNITMPSSPGYDYENHTFEAFTNGRGPIGGTGFVSVFKSVRYGNPSDSNRACKDRDFTLNPNAGPVQLLPDPETANSARFRSTASVSFGQPGGPGYVNGVFFDRRFFIRRGGGIINLSSPSPSSPDPRNTRVPSASLPLVDNGSLNPVAQVGDEVCQQVIITPRSGQIDTVGNIVVSDGVTIRNESCERVTGKPYFRVYNSDVSAGFASCTGWTSSPSSGTIFGFNDGSGKGSGTQLAAFAINSIDQFTSSTGRTSSPRPSKGLTFSNIGGGPYGNGYGSGFCAYDYYGARPTSGLTIPPGGTNIDLSSVSSGDYEISGNVRIRGNVASGAQITIYIDGNAFINGNINYPTSWASIDQIPNLTLVVKGNIYTSKDVTSVDGVFVAQPNGPSDGIIYTCAYGFGSIPNPSINPFFDDCKNQLTINGAFIAKQVKLMRTNGSLKDSANTENRNSSTIAERFIFSPELWLRSSVDPGTGAAPYEAITSAPPVL